MTMKEERAGKRHKGDGAGGPEGDQGLQSPTVQEIAEFLNVEMSPRSRAAAGPPAAEDAKGDSNKQIVETRTDQDNIDDGYRCLPGCLSFVFFNPAVFVFFDEPAQILHTIIRSITRFLGSFAFVQHCT